MEQKNKKLVTCHPSPVTDSKGFTLVELAMVLVVIGLLIGIGVSLIGPLTKRAKLIETREAVNQAKEAVLGWTVKNGYLPPDIATAGGKNVDGFSKDLYFIRATEIDASGKNACRTIAADPNNRTTLNICRNGDCTSQRVSNIAFVIVSGSENYNIQTEAGTPSGCPGGERCVNIYEIGTPDIDDYPVDMNRPELYDDTVQYVSLDEIRSAMGCQQPLTVTSPATLTEGEEDSYYTYSLQAIGGRPPYVWNTATPPGSGLTLNSSGLISGTINVNTVTSTGELTACSTTINVDTSVTDQVSSTPVPFTGSIPVRPKPLNITTQTLPAGYEGLSYDVYIFGTGGRRPNPTPANEWTVSSGSLPLGLSIATYTSSPCSTSQPCGRISGTITSDTGCSQPSPSNFTVKLDDGCGQPTYKAFSITVEDPDCAGGGPTTTTTTTTTTSTTTTTTTTTTLPPSPTCTLSASPGIVRYNETTTLNWTITNGPASGTFSPQSGTCTSFTGSSGGSCTTGALTTAGPNTFTLTLSPGGNTCQVTVYVGCQEYRVWNNAGGTRDYIVDSSCRNGIANNGEITTTTLRLNSGETIVQYLSSGVCAIPTGNSLTYDQAMNADVVINGGDGDCRVNFTGTDR